MDLKNRFSFFLLVAMLLGMVSCLGTGTEYEEVTNTDAQIISFGLSHDSIKVLAETQFSINQTNGIIFNYDSLPYLTNLADSLLKITYTTGSGLSQSLQIKEQINGKDTIYYKSSGDSIRLTNNRLEFTVFAPDSAGGRNKTYSLQVNIHQIDPDSVQYILLADDSEVPPVEKPWETVWSGVAHIPLGFLHPNAESLNDKGFAYIVSDGSKYYFKLHKGDAEITGEEVPNDFPLVEFSTLNHSSIFSDRLTVIGGYNADTIISNLQSVWATENGLYWANLVSTTDSLPNIKGAVAFNYNNEIWLAGGSVIDDNGNEKAKNHTIYYSQDGGVVWKAKARKAETPIDFDISNSSVTVDKDGKYFYIITPTAVWKACINSQLFEH
ncbi:MAG: DUF6242 domain-containing protein [Candidatus Symbiothrix sp.]|jgi:hypothetical protein|nr:DUF6242 domain-containing protein [Candidatus Symbiothrix sp.]